MKVSVTDVIVIFSDSESVSLLSSRLNTRRFLFNNRGLAFDNGESLHSAESKVEGIGRYLNCVSRGDGVRGRLGVGDVSSGYWKRVVFSGDGF